MAERGKGKAGRASSSARSAAAPRPASHVNVPAKVAAKATASPPPKNAVSPAAEIERLNAELAAAQSRIGELERQRDEAINRIDWVIDALKGLIEPRR